MPAQAVSSVTSSKRKGSPAVKFYAVKVGKEPGVYLTYKECEENITGFKGAIFKSFLDRADAEAFVAGLEVKSATPKSAGKGDKFYGVAVGRKPGVYTEWADAQEQIVGWKGPKYKKFPSRAEAEEFVRNGTSAIVKASTGSTTSKKQTAVEQYSDDDTADQPVKKRSRYSPAQEEELIVDAAEVENDENLYQSINIIQKAKPAVEGVLKIYTDGSSLGNGKAGARAGLGVWFGPNDTRNLSERLRGEPQTNQRGELMAILRALEIVSVTQNVEIITDSEYSINCVTVWHKSWERKNWQTSNRQPVMNQDIIKAVLAKIEERTVTRAATKFTWVKGHAADKGNIAADRLAVAGSNKPRRD